MPDAALAALESPGLWWLVLTISVAGIVRGFTGFGTALIFVPVAGLFLPTAQVIATITMTGVGSTIALVPRAWRHANHREVGVLVIAALPTVPLGLMVMDVLNPVTVRWVVAAVAGFTLAMLVSGRRFDGQVKLPGLLLIGALAGLIGGVTGLTGPMVILFYLAGQAGAQTVRANTIVFLAALDVVIVANLFLRGFAGWEVVWLAVILGVPYFITTLIGQALFDPERERLYRYAAFTVIGLALLTGLPIWQ
ncbi:sulfite exporter TauE/SafE family protein [Roseovarius aestuarii]|nr:sulfite exporter TauE/SafE family protein [Roseovarius aestuarii]